ncbi:uncharacterized protein N7458_000474 [Penicillium daleae]|uniref:Aspergillopepsin-2 n=1 Tax=Penicillium daleae TaxID=63821 RepID=A0AAD6G7F9_9EURO|nr:uncharacterized protein N7458_000474 [Penicillium daleae]KAJ5464788.1 hypothetical protein N7458_000474 [Penicillium daleae]
MKLSAAITTIVLATFTLAAPQTEMRQARHNARSDGKQIGRKTSRPQNRHNNALEEYSSNWAGAILIGNGYTGVSAEFTVPKPQAPSGASSNTQYCASAWVGIDGDTCTSAILQTGVDFCIQNGVVSYDAWYEWYPDYAYDFTGITISAGDLIKVSVDATSTITGTAILENLSTGQSEKHTFTSGVQGDLCEYNAEWIVEDFEENNGLVPFANFSTVTFSNAQATDGGSVVGPSGATLIDIEQNGVVLTQSSNTNDSVTIDYS